MCRAQSAHLNALLNLKGTEKEDRPSLLRHDEHFPFKGILKHNHC